MKGSKLAVVLLLGILIVASIACGGKTVNESNSGSQIYLSVGETFVVKLASNPSTGYSWNLSAITNTSIINKTSNAYIPPSVQIPGRGGQETWKFQALSVGTATISMKYIQPWEPEAEPADTFEITVSVK